MGLARKLTGLVIAAAATGALAIGAGFIAFTWSVARAEPEQLPQADGIVALTGGAHRVADAAALLSRGQAKRLLVTGVNPATSRQDLARKLGAQGRLVDCCIDLDYAALNTVGNAVETRKWVVEHGFRSIIVVTSSYHMPRTLMELRRRLPDVEIHPYPVVSAAVDMERWWEHPTTMRLLTAEYAKYLYALVRRPAPEPEPVSAATAAPTLASDRRIQ